ncbi:MAG: SoxR reducing system RseC family protein [Elusimicrobiota bacterium]
MMRETGTVLEALNNGLVSVEMERKSKCDHCDVCSRHDSNLMKLEVISHIPVKAGDRVLIEIESKSFLKISALTYAIPILLLFLGYYLGSFIAGVFGFKNQFIGIVSAFVIVIGYFIFLMKISKSYKESGVLKIVGIVSSEEKIIEENI